jgi:hypothetical protein
MTAFVCFVDRALHTFASMHVFSFKVPPLPLQLWWAPAVWKNMHSSPLQLSSAYTIGRGMRLSAHVIHMHTVDEFTLKQINTYTITYTHKACATAT